MNKIRSWLFNYYPFIFLFCLLSFFSVIIFENFLLFHFLAEMITIVLSLMIFSLYWDGLNTIDNTMIKLLSIGFFFIAIIDTGHTISYKGMGILNLDDPNIPTQLWIAGRIMQAITIFLAVFLKRAIRPGAIFLIYALSTLIIFAGIFKLHFVPAAYIEGKGLTNFKIIMEYIIIFILLISAYWLILTRNRISRQIVVFLILTILFSILSELCFTLYSGVYDFSNALGHMLKVIAFFLLYRAIFVYTLSEPQKILFKNLLEEKREAEKLTSIIERSPIVTILWQNKKNWPIELISSNALEVLGYSADDFLNNSILYTELIHPEDIQLVSDEVKSNSEKGIISFEHTPYRIISKNGEMKWIRDITHIRRDENGEITHYEGIILDISNLKQTEKKLSQYFHAVESSPTSITITNTMGIIEYANPKFTQITGFSEKEAIGRNMNILNSGTQDIKFYRDLWETILSGKEWRGVFCNKKKNGEIFWEKASISSIKDEKNKIIRFIGLKEDITQEKETEKKLLIAVEDAKRANRVKSDFLANMSHEIRTPMNAILGFSELLLSRIKTGEDHEFLQSINISGKRLLTLINNILDLSKIEAEKIKIDYTSCNLHTIFNNLHSLFFLKTKEKNLKFSGKFTPDMPENLLLDEDKLSQVLINIIGNAVKFTNEGYVKITFSHTFLKNDKKSISLVIDIDDSGIGIPENEWENIFNAFDQTQTGSQAQYGGTGLGLAISRELVNLMDGNLNIVKKDSRGSLFRLTLNKVKIASQIPLSSKIDPIQSPVHTKSDSTANADKQNNPASKKTLDILPLIKILKGNSMETYNRLSKAINMNLIKEFSEEIYVLGKKYNILLLTSWSESMDNALRNFDKTKIKETLSIFPNLITQIEQIKYLEERNVGR